MEGLKIRKDKEGNIVELTAQDAHTLRVKVYYWTGELLIHEAIVIPSLDALESLLFMTDPYDNTLYIQKWSLDKFVLLDLKSKGEAEKINSPCLYKYSIRKTKHADNLRHKG